MNRRENISRLQSEHFDICVIGGGVSGAGCALDASLRGYKVALIERADFASETSSKSTKLIHGGVRYLEQAFKNLDFGQLRQVRHGLDERHIVLSNAPHLASALALVTPVSNWFSGLYYSLGLKLYDWFSRGDILPGSRWLSKRELLERIPTLNTSKVHSGVLYYDGQLNDARYCLAIVQSASESGAVTANYTELTGFEKDASGKLVSAVSTDLLAGDQIVINASLFINCTGPFADHVRHEANAGLPGRIRTSKGVHAVLPLEVLNSTEAMLIPETPDGRVVFAIPFEGKLLLGTTDTEYNDLDREPLAEESEVEFLLNTLSPYLAVKPDRSRVSAGFGGVRPLLAADPSKTTKRLTRDHEVEHDAASNLLSLLGGKWTTYRLMASDTIDVAGDLLGTRRPCTTGEFVLAGGEEYRFEKWKVLSAGYGLSEDISKHLMRTYGARAMGVAALIAEQKELSERLLPDYPFIKAEVIFAVRYEMVMVPRDFLARRIRLEITDWKACLLCLPVVTGLMKRELGWDQARADQLEASYRELIQGFMKVAGSKS